MPPIKQQLAHLNNARLRHFKKQKLEQSQSINTSHLCVDDDQLCTSNTSNKEDKEDFSFQNENVNKTDSDTECNWESDEEELDFGPEESRIGKKAVLETQPREI